jgi:hypothetical protein
MIFSIIAFEVKRTMYAGSVQIEREDEEGEASSRAVGRVWRLGDPNNRE